jgi:hypothetical protein
MPARKKGPRHHKAGRPGYDALALFIRIEAGRRAADMNVYAYTLNRALPVARAGRGGRILTIMSGSTLHRHYYRILDDLRGCYGAGSGEALPPLVEKLVVERISML